MTEFMSTDLLGLFAMSIWRKLLFSLRLLPRLVVLIGLFFVLPVLGFSQTRAADATNPIPIMAYYYIWYDTQSWNRAKIDYPLLGRYSSDDSTIMEQHIQWAKDAGISGFIVSWKSTLVLDRRLQMLIDLAEKNNFKLWIMYQGLDFDRKPLSVEQIDSDLDYFAEHFSSSPAFAGYERPVVILSGTWEFTVEQIKTITTPYRDRLDILASEHNVDGYLRIANYVDGNAYYWSSVNPNTFPNYQGKLDSMAQAIHDHGGLWIAPAAPGFDARLIGGTSVVERNDGQTLRTELDTAVRSSADAVGLISWNEFSENSYVEPSQKFGSQYLDLLADREATLPPTLLDFDLSAQGSVSNGQYYGVYLLGGTFLFVTFSISLAIGRRSGKRH